MQLPSSRLPHQLLMQVESNSRWLLESRLLQVGSNSRWLLDERRLLQVGSNSRWLLEERRLLKVGSNSRWLLEELRLVQVGSNQWLLGACGRPISPTPIFSLDLRRPDVCSTGLDAAPYLHISLLVWIVACFVG